MKSLLTLMLTLVCATSFAEESRNNIVFVLDDSGSMDSYLGKTKSSRLEVAKSALSRSIGAMDDSTSLGIICLNRGWVLPLQPLSKEVAVIQLGQVDSGGGTSLAPAMQKAGDALLGVRESEKYGSYKMVIVTDGLCNNENLVDSYRADIMVRGIKIDVIGLDLDGGHSLATKVHSYQNANDPSSLTEVLKNVLAESPQTVDGEDPYEILEGFPAEFAVAGLDSLGSSGNHPIGTTPVTVVDEQGNESVAYTPTDDGSGFMSIVIIFFTVVLGIGFAAFLVASGKRP